LKHCYRHRCQKKKENEAKETNCVQASDRRDGDGDGDDDGKREQPFRNAAYLVVSRGPSNPNSCPSNPSNPNIQGLSINPPISDG